MAFKTHNLHYAFNVEYYDNEPEAANKALEMIASDGKNCYRNSDCSFELQTCYPGLLAGIGNFHGSARKNELDAGFSFDYVTGMPYIPGSSIKGAIRSAFKQEEYIRALLKRDDIDVKKLEDEIFEGVRDGADIPVPLRDTFFDAFPKTKGKLMSIEAITPHGDDFKSPNPLSFIKVKPNVVFEFAFNLHAGTMTAEDKFNLFKDIIKDLGLGAKTNVGFGAFADVDKNKPFVDAPVAAEVQRTERSERKRGAQSDSDTIICVDCGKTYRLNDFEKKKVRDEGWTIKRCKECQIANKTRRNR